MTKSIPEFAGIIDKPKERAGGHTLALSIGRLIVRIEGLPEKIYEKVMERYSVNLAPGGPSDHRVVVFKGAEHYLEKPADGFLKIEEGSCGKRLVMVSSDFAAYVEEGMSEGSLLLSDPEDTASSTIAVENYLLRVFSRLALRSGGFMLHSCGLEKDGAAYIFFGSSGSGKSALATMTPGLKILSDDMVLIFHEDGRYMAASTPFWGALTRLTRENLVLPVAGCYRIRKTTRTECVEVGGPKALGMLLPCCPFIADEETRNRLLIPNLLGFIGKTRVCELYLPLEPKFWDLITEGPPHGLA